MNELVNELLKQKYTFEYRVIKGLASDEERNIMMSRVASALPTLDPGDFDDSMDITDLLNILSYAGDTAPLYKGLVASYLHGPGTTPAIMALSVLCYFYNLTPDYVQEISKLMRGVPWDSEYSVQEFATGVAGTFLRKRSEPMLLRTLIEIVENGTISEDPRTNALSALEAALGLSEESILAKMRNAKAGIHRESLDEASILRLAKERLKQEV
jgi:hypothetical protein